MKSLLKHLYAWITLLFQTIVSSICIIFFSSLRAVRKIVEIRNNRVKDECIIIGNGPSLRFVLEKYLDNLSEKNADFCVVNSFCDSSYFFKLKPRYYVLADPLFFKNEVDSFVAKQKSNIVAIFAKINWDMKFMVPNSAKESLLLNQITNNHVDICFYNLTPVVAFKKIENYFFIHNLGLPNAMNVLISSIFLMINVGYKNIYLLGADNNWLKSFDIDQMTNDLVLIDSHFYDNGRKRILNKSVGLKIDEWLRLQSVGFNSHIRLNEYANYRGVKIYNSTYGSLIDAYDRKYLYNG